MKKVLIYLFIAMYLFTPAFAQGEIKKVKKDNFFTKIKNNISYENQRKAEEEYYNQMCMGTSDIVAKGETIESVLGIFIPNEILIQEDYLYYQKKGGSIIGDIYKTLEDIENKGDFENKQFNIDILNKIISQYKSQINYVNQCKLNASQNIYNPLLYKPNRIMLSNQDFDKLEEDVKNHILLINFIFFDKASVQQTYYKFLDTNINGILNKYNKQFTENKNNLAKLNDLYNLISSEKDKLTSLSKEIKLLNKQNEYNKEYIENNKYNDLNLVKLKNNVQNIIQSKKHKLTSDSNENDIFHYQSDYCISLVNKIDNTIDKIAKLQNSISSYGFSVEKTSYNNWLKKNNVKPISKTTLSNYVYGTYYEAPNKNFLYKHIPIYPVQVLQSVNGGVLLTGNYSIIQADNIQVVFLETNKKYANGYILRNPLILEYKGIYNYYNTFGAKNSIYWFRELSQAEINKKYASLPNYYFFNPNI